MAMTDLETDFFNVLRTLDKRPQDTFSNYDIGVPLIGQGHSQDSIVGLLLRLEGEGFLKLVEGNRTMLLKAAP